MTLIEGHATGWVRAPSADFRSGPYPGERPAGSWLLTSGGEVHELAATPEGWVDLGDGSRADLADRALVLAYGSNLNPAKLAARLGGETVIALAADVHDWAAVWCAARRSSDDAVVATLAPWPGAVERHAVLALTEAQVAVVDRWEGHPTQYRRTAFLGRCVLDTGDCECEIYLGTSERRPALHLGGALVRVFGPDALTQAQVAPFVPSGWHC